MFHDCQLRASHGRDDVGWNVKAKVEIDWCAKEIIDMNDLVANMERDERQPAGRQHLSQSPHDEPELVRLDMNDRIERDDPRETPCRQVEVPYIAHTKVQLGIEL